MVQCESDSQLVVYVCVIKKITTGVGVQGDLHLEHLHRSLGVETFKRKQVRRNIKWEQGGGGGHCNELPLPTQQASDVDALYFAGWDVSPTRYATT